MNKGIDLFLEIGLDEMRYTTIKNTIEYISSSSNLADDLEHNRVEGGRMPTNEYWIN